MKRRYDVIVVGARCAGAPTAMLLARNGYKVLLVDRSRFPSEIPHGHFIHRHGPRRLRGWGLLSRLIAAGCPPSTTITMDTGDICLVGGDLVVDGIAAGYGPRRAVLGAGRGRHRGRAPNCVRVSRSKNTSRRRIGSSGFVAETAYMAPA